MRYQQNMEKEVSVIAHSCGVPEARQLRRQHCRIVQGNGRSVSLDELFPLPATSEVAPSGAIPLPGTMRSADRAGERDRA